ncbi:hypothetical protein TWF506_005757 [Arthrobotrys conoides]|uniref:Uncharacterized protein n=1 Tax=Arthrobotrys conoides TaxID=74498 RepID=A0AAN8RX30_9PEZI
MKMNMSRISLPSILLLLSLIIPAVTGVPVAEDTIEVTHKPEEPSKAKPPLVSANQLDKRPVWRVFYDERYRIRCEEPDVSVVHLHQRAATHADSLTAWTHPLEAMLGADHQTAMDMLETFTSLCQNCDCYGYDDPRHPLQLKATRSDECPQDTVNFCRFISNCFCETNLEERKKQPKVPIRSNPSFTITKDGKRGGQQTFEEVMKAIRDAATGGSLSMFEIQFDEASGQNVVESIEPPRRERVPGTKEPYYLEGPNSDMDRDPLVNFPFRDGSNAHLGIFKRDEENKAQKG